MNKNVKEEPEETAFDAPLTQGPKVLALFVEIDPLDGLESEDQRYRDRAERFCANLLWRRVTGEITPEFINLSVERIFTTAELIDEVKPEALQDLKYRICQLYFK